MSPEKSRGEGVNREVQIEEQIKTYRHDLGEAAEGMGRMSAQDVINTKNEIKTLEAELKKIEGDTEK